MIEIGTNLLIAIIVLAVCATLYGIVREFRKSHRGSDGDFPSNQN